MSILRKEYGRTVNPGGSQERTFCIPITLAADALPNAIPLLVSTSDLYLKAAYFVSDADVAANDTNYREFSLQDRGADGTGTTAAGTAAKSTKVTGGTAIVDYVPWSLGATEGYKLAANQVLALLIAGSGTEPALSGTVVVICK